MAEDKITTLVAWWGAILSTIVFAWDVYKWKTSGPVLKVTITPNMQYYEGAKRVDDTDYIIANISNVGQRQTTVTSIGLQYYGSWLGVVLNKPKASYYVKNEQVPYKLEVGTYMTAKIIQNDDVVKKAQKGFLYCWIHDSTHANPARKRIIIPKSIV